MNRRTILTAAGAAILSTGCSMLAKWLPRVISALGQAGQVLDAIDTAARSWFTANPNAEAEARYVSLMGKARAALAATHAAAEGTDELAHENTVAAFEAYRQAYAELLKLLGPMGIVAPATDGALSTGDDGALMVPAPEALTL